MNDNIVEKLMEQIENLYAYVEELEERIKVLENPSSGAKGRGQPGKSGQSMDVVANGVSNENEPGNLGDILNQISGIKNGLNNMNQSLFNNMNSSTSSYTSGYSYPYSSGISWDPYDTSVTCSSIKK